MGTARILVVDDDPSLLKLMLHMLKNKGYETAVTTSGAEGVRRARSQCVDVAILDMNMPEPDGFEVINQLREPCPDCRILAVSGHQHLLESARHLGADAILQKPFTQAQLLDKVRSLLTD